MGKKISLCGGASSGNGVVLMEEQTAWSGVWRIINCVQYKKELGNWLLNYVQKKKVIEMCSKNNNLTEYVIMSISHYAFKNLSLILSKNRLLDSDRYSTKKIEVESRSIPRLTGLKNVHVWSCGHKRISPNVGRYLHTLLKSWIKLFATLFWFYVWKMVSDSTLPMSH